jgi:hypothetical protein
MSRVALRSIAAVVSAAGSLYVADVSIARGETDSCAATISSYVRELDGALGWETTWIMPFARLNSQYFPILDCDPDTILEAVSRSRFIKKKDYLSKTRRYAITFENETVRVFFIYSVDLRRAEDPSVGWVNK